MGMRSCSDSFSGGLLLDGGSGLLEVLLVFPAWGETYLLAVEDRNCL